MGTAIIGGRVETPDIPEEIGVVAEVKGINRRQLSL